MNRHQFKAFLNPNPPMTGETLINPWGENVLMKNDPFLEIHARGLIKGKYDISMISPFRKELEAELLSPISKIVIEDRRFADPKISEVSFVIKSSRTKKTITLPVKCQKIEGKIRDFSGKQRQGYLWATKRDYGDYVMENEIMAKSDINGKFEIFVPNGRPLRLFVADNWYGNKSLECWLMADELKENFKFTPHIRGKLEVYELKAWVFLNVWNIFFLPASVDNPFPPKIYKENIKVKINSRISEIKKFTSTKVCFSGEKKELYYPSYIISGVLKEKATRHKDKMVFSVRISLKNGYKAEAFYILYLN